MRSFKAHTLWAAEGYLDAEIQKLHQEAALVA
jgi:hypothetical protein